MAYAFTLDRDGAAEVLKVIAAEEVSSLASAVSAAAGPESSIETKTTKTRFVAIVKVLATLQAADGLLSKAAGSLGLKINQYPKGDRKSAKKPGFASRVQWRWAFWSKQPWARPKARETPGEKIIRYQNLPERSGNGTPNPSTPRKPRKK